MRTIDPTWSLSVDMLDGVGVAHFRGIVTEESLAKALAMFTASLERSGVCASVLCISPSALLAVSDEASAAVALQSLPMRGAEWKPAALVVPEALFCWAMDHCLRLTRRGLPRAAFLNPQEALQWAREEAWVLAPACLKTKRKEASNG
jgi:hypothetical protein